MKRILIIEDDPAFLKGLEVGLRDEHYETITATTGEEGYRKAKSRKFDLIILDIMLPDRNGFEVCQDLRNDGMTTPILILTNKREEIDQVEGFSKGANEYLVKPIGLRLLIAHIDELLRAPRGIKQPIEITHFDNVVIDFKKMEATKNGAALQLSVREFEMLRYFVEHEGEPVTRHMFLTDVWGYKNDESIPTTRTIDTFIGELRKKIEEFPKKPRHLLKIPRKGYKFVM